MSLFLDILAGEALYGLGVVLAAVVHEGGHAGMALLVGSRLRLVNIGMGPPLLRVRLGQCWLVWRAVPITGLVWRLLQLDETRAARAAVVIGGILGNAAVLACLGLIYLADSGSFETLLPIGLAQVLFIGLVAIPMSSKWKGMKLSTDGLKLLRIVFRRETEPLAACQTAHAELIQPLLATGVPLPPMSEEMPEIIYQVARRDRLSEAWAARDASDVLRGLLELDRLPTMERAFALDFLVSNELLFGRTGASRDDIDRWSCELIALADRPEPRILRGGTLVALGRAAEAEALLTGMLDEAGAAGGQILCRAFLAQAAAAEGDLPRAQSWLSRARALLPVGARGAVIGAVLKRIETRLTVAAAPPPSLARRDAAPAGTD